MTDNFIKMLQFRFLLEKQVSKLCRRPLRTAKDVLMLVIAIQLDFDVFTKYGDNAEVWVTVDDKGKIIQIKLKEPK